jgi:hypothetical protein
MVKLNRDFTIQEIIKKLIELNLPHEQQYEKYSNQEIIKVCRMFKVSPYYFV